MYNVLARKHIQYSLSFVTCIHSTHHISNVVDCSRLGVSRAAIILMIRPEGSKFSLVRPST